MGDLLIKNYKFQNPVENYILSYYINHEMKKRRYYPTRGSHGLHQDSYTLQTMTALNQKLLQGVQGGGFLEKSPPGRPRQR
jgi:hypothetical protein